MKKKKVNPIFVLLWNLSKQKKIIDDHCFGTCKNIIFGALKDKELGPLMVCRTLAKDCPHFDKEMDEPFGDLNGIPIFIRKLKE